jgi:Tfp pilus assembly protein PilO
MSSMNLNLEWVKRPAVFGTIIGTIVIALVWWMAWMSPEASKLSAVETQQTAAQGQIAQLQGEIASLKAQSTQLTKEIPYLKFFQSQIPPLPLQGQLTAQLYQLSLTTHTFISALSDNSVAPPTTASVSSTSGSTASPAYSTMPISIEVAGSHNGVAAFLQGLYHLGRLVTIQQVSLTPPTQSPNLNSNTNTSGFSAAITATAYTTYVPANPTAPTTAPTGGTGSSSTSTSTSTTVAA